jgi:hypothetical protein
VLVLAVWAYQDGKPTRETLIRGSELMAELVPYKMTMANFDTIARREGRAELRRQFAVNLIEYDDFLDQMVEEALKVMSSLLKAKTN